MERVGRLLFPAVLLLAAYYAVFGGEYSYFELRGLRGELEEAQSELVRLQAENERLQLRADSLESDLYTIERLARELGLLKENEELLQPVWDSAQDTTGSPGSERDGRTR